MSASAAAISGRRPATGRGMRRAILALALFAALALAAGFWIDLADRRLAATLIAQSTLLSAATLPVWMAVAEGLGR